MPGEIRYPKDHKPGMSVPRGGSMCANCKYLKDAAKRECGEPNFVRWNGSSTIPGNIYEYCSDWYEPMRGPIRPKPQDPNPEPEPDELIGR